MHCRAEGLAILDDEMKAIVTHACAAEASFALAEMERLNIEALATMKSRNNVQLRTFPADLVSAARTTANDVLTISPARARARKSPPLLHRLSRQGCGLVADFDAGRAGSAGRGRNARGKTRMAGTPSGHSRMRAKRVLGLLELHHLLPLLAQPSMPSVTTSPALRNFGSGFMPSPTPAACR